MWLSAVNFGLPTVNGVNGMQTTTYRNLQDVWDYCRDNLLLWYTCAKKHFGNLPTPPVPVHRRHGHSFHNASFRFALLLVVDVARGIEQSHISLVSPKIYTDFYLFSFVLSLHPLFLLSVVAQTLRRGDHGLLWHVRMWKRDQWLWSYGTWENRKSGSEEDGILHKKGLWCTNDKHTILFRALILNASISEVYFSSFKASP